MCADSFRTLDVTQVRRQLARLFAEVARDGERVEITQRGASGACVLISKEELESLERALEILSDTPNVRALRRSLRQVLAAAAPAAAVTPEAAQEALAAVP